MKNNVYCCECKYVEITISNTVTCNHIDGQKEFRESLYMADESLRTICNEKNKSNDCKSFKRRGD